MLITAHSAHQCHTCVVFSAFFMKYVLDTACRMQCFLHRWVDQLLSLDDESPDAHVGKSVE